MKTLIVEDSSTLCAIYEAYLDDSGYEVHTVETFTGALMALESLKPDLILLDIELPDGNGLDLLAETVLMKPQPAVVVMTGHGIEFADQAIERGADDFLGKPFDASRLRVTLANVAQRLELTQKLSQLGEKRERLGSILGSSDVMQVVYTTIESLASSRATALITGESGTGKELLARAVHTMSTRSEEKFVAINCAAIPENMLEALLFGHKKGAFTGASTSSDGIFQAADSGTLLLDEVSEMSMPLQAKLLRVLQERSVVPLGASAPIPVDVRTLATSNRNIPMEIRRGRFREDLYFRLNVFPLATKALNERLQDIIPIAAELLVRHQSDLENFPTISGPALQRLLEYSWPGNVRELENVIQRATVLRNSNIIEFEDIMIDTPSPEYHLDEPLVSHV